jgi:rhamnulokinase
MLPNLVAMDLGAESCRVSLLRWREDRPSVELVHRFPNAPTWESGHLRWDLRKICDGIIEGLHNCAAAAPEGIASIGVDGWAVDYVRLNEAGEPLANPVCYRDQRTQAAAELVHAHISAHRLYELTGVQILPLNTVYQLRADGSQGIEQSAPWLNLPEFILHWLGGRRVSEYTNATHTQLLSIATRKWSREILGAAGLDMSAVPPVVEPGSDVGVLRGPLSRLATFGTTRLIAPACHDTASAIAGIPAAEDGWAFISSGTWSLVGRVLESPCVSRAAREANFSNEGGVGGKINFLKNVNGMWLLQQCIEQWRSQGGAWTPEELQRECETLRTPPWLLDVDDPALLAPGNMLARISDQLTRQGRPPISSECAGAPEVANLIFQSLAARYAKVLRDLAAITGARLRGIYIVGGGSKNRVLNRLTEQATGLPVRTGAAESATMGNLAIQLAALAGGGRRSAGVEASAVARWAGILAGAQVSEVETQYAC